VTRRANTSEQDHFRVLVIEDDPASRTLLTSFLTVRGYQVREARTGEEAIELAAGCDVALVDVGLPDMDGWELAEVLRRELPELPLVFVTGWSDREHLLLGFELGAQDYVVKPVDLEELDARLKVVTLRARPRNLLDFDDLVIDLGARAVWRHEARIDLSPLEFDLLALLARHPQRVWSRDELLRRVWPNFAEVIERNVDVRIQHLRKALGDDAGTPSCIETVRGKGYRWLREPSTSPRAAAT
jgi:DNA-binding response OmpR family regulator